MAARNDREERIYRAVIAQLVAARRAAGLRQTDVSQVLGKPQPFISRYENFERRLNVAEFVMIAEALGQDPLTILDHARREAEEG